MKKPPMIHIYPSREPEDMFRIVGNKNALLELSKKLRHAAVNGCSFENMYSGDGHKTTVMVVREDDDSVWEYLESPYTDPIFSENRVEYVAVDNLEHIDNYKKLRKNKK